MANVTTFSTDQLYRTVGLSVVWTGLAVAFHLIFTLFILAGADTFLLELPSRMGTSTTLLLSDQAMTISLLYLAASLIATLIVSAAAERKKYDLLFVAAVLQQVFSALFLAPFIGNIVENAYGNGLVTAASVVAVFVILGISLVKLSRPPQAESGKKAQPKKTQPVKTATKTTAVRKKPSTTKKPTKK